MDGNPQSRRERVHLNRAIPSGSETGVLWKKGLFKDVHFLENSEDGKN